MHRLVGALVTVCLMSAGVSPCVASMMAAPVSQHDCCDPDETATGSADAALPIVAGGPADCCVVAPGPLAPATAPVVTAPASDPAAAPVADPVLHRPFAVALPSGPIDSRSRSAPRPPRLTVLLI